METGSNAKSDAGSQEEPKIQGIETPLGAPPKTEDKKPHRITKRWVRTNRISRPRTLAIDVGGTGIKAEILDSQGKPVTERTRVQTPHPATPAAVLGAIQKITDGQGGFERVSVGFPGVVKFGTVLTAPNLSPRWKKFNLGKALHRIYGKPVRVSNDADVQGYGVIRGHGVEMVITLGTGVGSALFVDGKLVPNLELGHHPFIKGKTYEEKLSHAALDAAGKKKWNKRLKKAVRELQLIFNFDRLYLGGGDAKHIDFKLPENVKVVSNQAGLWGGIALWQEASSR
ncbi:MAG: ROK family protein [Acidobacteriia bacterium]|nr:ROK family protein [Terriglobia bacterium]